MNRFKKYSYYIGIDPGVQTGLCVYCRFDKTIRHLSTVPIHEAMEAIKYWKELSNNSLIVWVEDARERKWFGHAGKERLQGAGSIKRDCKIWDDYLRFLKVDYEMVPPKNNITKMEEGFFKKITGFTGRCSVHARAAAMLVFGM